MARFLVTGGCGFIGSHLVDRLLAEGAQVVVLDDLSTGRKENLAPGAELIIGDIRDRNSVRDAMTGVDGCFHLAAIASVEKAREAWSDTHAVNLAGTVTIFDAARHASSKGPVPVVYASSAAVYGNPGDDWKGRISEEAPTVPLSAYGADKLGCELHGRVAWTVHGVPTVGFRFFNVYGPRQDPASPYSGVISIFANRVAKRRPDQDQRRWRAASRFRVRRRRRQPADGRDVRHGTGSQNFQCLHRPGNIDQRSRRSAGNRVRPKRRAHPRTCPGRGYPDFHRRPGARRCRFRSLRHRSLRRAGPYQEPG